VSRIRRLSHAISEEGRRSQSISQALRIRESALSVIEQANTSANSSRRIHKEGSIYCCSSLTTNNTSSSILTS
jgi:hypothetical protein